MNDFFGNLIDNLRENLTTVLAGFLVLVILGGFIFFTVSFILPQWRLRSELLTQLETAEQAAENADQSENDTITDLRAQIEQAPEQLQETAAFLLSADAADQTINTLYQYAGDSDVDITSLQARDITTEINEEVPYYVKRYQLEARGAFNNLLGFVGAIEATRQPGYILSNVNASEGNTDATLSMQIALYISPYATGTLALAEPEDDLTTNLAEQPETVVYVVLPGDTLLSIAKLYNVPLSTIQAVNEMSDSALSPGQALLIPR